MPFARTPLKTLIARAISDIHARLPGADALLPTSNLNVLAHVSAAAAHGLYGYLDWLARQLMVDTAEEEYFARHASIRGVARRQAVPAEGPITLSGTPDVTLDSGALFSGARNARYRLIDDVTFVTETAEGRVVAVEPGISGNLYSGTLTLTSSEPGVRSTATVAGEGIGGGTDIETLESWRARVLDRIRRPPRGGALHDYEAWAMEVPGVTRVWPAPETPEPGYVTVRFVRDFDEDFIPNADELARVYEHIAAVKPVQAHLIVVPPTPVPIHFEIDAIPATFSVQEAIEAELRDLLLREAAPGAPILRSHINEAISIALGEVDHTLIAPVSNVIFAPHEIAVFGDIVWA